MHLDLPLFASCSRADVMICNETPFLLGVCDRFFCSVLFDGERDLATTFVELFQCCPLESVSDKQMDRPITSDSKMSTFRP